MLDLNFRKLFGAMLDSANALANFLLALPAKQVEKLGVGGGAAARSRREDGTHAIGAAPASSAGPAVMMLQPGASARIAGLVEAATSSTQFSSPLTSSHPSSSIGSAAGSGGGCTVLESWILQEVAKNASSVLQVLPREWGAVLGYAHDAIPLHIYKLMIALRRAVVPLKKWQRLTRADKNIISWTALLHHIARSDCVRHSHSSSGSDGGHSSTPHPHPRPPPLRCDFLCSLSSCIVAVDILARQGFAKKDRFVDPLAPPPVPGSPRSPGGSPAPYIAPGTYSSASSSSGNSRELHNWIRRAEKLRRQLKEARDGAKSSGSHTNNSIGGSAGASSLSVSPPSSRPSTPPSSPSPSSTASSSSSSSSAPSSDGSGGSSGLAPRSDGFPHPFDLLELVAGLEPIFGTDTASADILKCVLLQGLVSGLGGGDNDHDETGVGVHGVPTAVPSSSSSSGTAASSAPEEPEAFQHVLLSNSSNNDATTSLTSSSSLPPGASRALEIEQQRQKKHQHEQRDQRLRLDNDAEAERAFVDAAEAAAFSSSSSSAAPPAAPASLSRGRHGLFRRVPASLLAILPRLVGSPRLFECVYLFALAHAASAFLDAHPSKLQRSMIQLQDAVNDLQHLWARQAKQARATQAKNQAASAAAVATAATASAPAAAGEVGSIDVGL
jgi:hypothetical protein